MSSPHFTWKLFGPLLVLVALTPLTLHWGIREIKVVRRNAVVHAASTAPIPAFTIEFVDLIGPGSTVNSSATESLHLTTAQRADGSRVDQVTNYPGQANVFIDRNIKFSDGVNIHAADSIGLKTTFKATPRSLLAFQHNRAARRTPGSACATDSFGEPVAPMAQYVANGPQIFAALGNLPTAAFSKLSPPEQVLFAPQLDCEMVYRFTIFQNSSGGNDFSQRAAKTYSLGDPDPSLFNTSPLQEASPITVFLTQYRKIGWPEDQIQKQLEGLQPLETAYKNQ